MSPQCVWCEGPSHGSDPCPGDRALTQRGKARESEHIAECTRERRCYCGEPLDVSPGLHSPYGGWVALCPSCYDGAEDGNRERGTGATELAAVRGWSNSVDPWPVLVECCICERVKAADYQIEGHTHHGYGDPICSECAEDVPVAHAGTRGGTP